MPWTHAVPLRSALRRRHRARPGRLQYHGLYCLHACYPYACQRRPFRFFAPHPWSLIDGRLFWNPDCHVFVLTIMISCVSQKNRIRASILHQRQRLGDRRVHVGGRGSCTRAHCSRTSRLCSWPSRRQTNDRDTALQSPTTACWCSASVNLCIPLCTNCAGGG